MIIYNVTILIENETIAEEWLQWMKSTHIPDVMACGLFLGHTLSRIVEPPPAEGVQYSTQYRMSSMADYEQYRDNFAPALQADHNAKYGGKFIAFRSIMTIEDIG